MANGQNNQKRPAAAGTKAKKKKKSKIILLVLELMVVAVLVAALWVLKDFGTSEGPQLNVEISEKDLEINTPVQENEVMKGYRNIALFGVDSRTGALTKGTLSDCIIIASINQDTGDVKLVSVYRDTYLNLGNDKYNKCNGAYSHGGAEQALKMLNMNLDMDIKEFVTIGFEGLTAAVDALGGVYLDVDEEELKHINNYQKCMAEDLKVAWEPVESTGYQLLNGLQATAYCRIRYRKGNDFARAASQREVIQAIIAEARKKDLATLVKVVNDVSSYIYTSFSVDDVVALLPDLPKYSIVDEGGFPEASMRGSSTLGSKGSCVYPINLTENVTWLHEFLFDETGYDPSDEVKANSKVIHDFVSEYVNID